MVAIPVSIKDYASGIQDCAVTAEIKNYKLIIKKKKKKHDKIVLLRKDKSNTIQFLISKALIDSTLVMTNLFLVHDG